MTTRASSFPRAGTRRARAPSRPCCMARSRPARPTRSSWANRTSLCSTLCSASASPSTLYETCARETDERRLDDAGCSSTPSGRSSSATDSRPTSCLPSAAALRLCSCGPASPSPRCVSREARSSIPSPADRPSSLRPRRTSSVCPSKTSPSTRWRVLAPYSMSDSCRTRGGLFFVHAVRRSRAGEQVEGRQARACRPVFPSVRLVAICIEHSSRDK